MPEQLTCSSVKTNKPHRQLLSALYFITLAQKWEPLWVVYGEAVLNAGRCGSPPEQQSLWSTAIYWSSELVQSIQEKRRGETTLEEKIAYLRSLSSGRGGSVHILIGQVLYVDPARTHRARWKEMHFSTETNRKALYYFLWSARNVMRKLAEGGKKQWSWAGWDEIWDEAMKHSRHAAIESSELGGHSKLRYCTR